MMFKSEERQVAEKIKEFIKKSRYPWYSYYPSYNYIMLRNGNILNIPNYYYMIKTGKVNPQDAYVFIGIKFTPFKADLYYPFLSLYYEIFEAFLSKLGFYYEDHVVPATGLKYIAIDAECEKGYLLIEVSDLLTVVDNTNLRKIVFEVVGDKIISGEKKLTYEEYSKILDMYKSQRLFAGHNFDEARNILKEYYYEGNKSLAKEAARIVMDYDRIFQPFRVCYETRTWNEVNCF